MPSADDPSAPGSSRTLQWALRCDRTSLAALVRQYAEAAASAAAAARGVEPAPAAQSAGRSNVFGFGAAAGSGGAGGGAGSLAGARAGGASAAGGGAGSELCEVMARHEAETWRLLQVRGDIQPPLLSSRWATVSLAVATPWRLSSLR